MRDEKVYKDPKWVALAAWSNSSVAFKYPLKDVVVKSEKMKRYYDRTLYKYAKLINTL